MPDNFSQRLILIFCLPERLLRDFTSFQFLGIFVRCALYYWTSIIILTSIQFIVRTSQLGKYWSVLHGCCKLHNAGAFAIVCLFRILYSSMLKVKPVDFDDCDSFLQCSIFSLIIQRTSEEVFFRRKSGLLYSVHSNLSVNSLGKIYLDLTDQLGHLFAWRITVQCRRFKQPNWGLSPWRSWKP